MLQHIELLPLLGGLVAGYIVFFVIKAAEHEVIMKYPDPMNPGEHTYRDLNGLCYTFKRQEVGCSAEKETRPYPLN